MTHGKKITIYWVDGNPDGIITGELFGWSCKCLKLPREQVSCNRKELSLPGVYFLICADTSDGEDAVYIGESNDVQTRLTQHLQDFKSDKEKYYWQNVVVFTSYDLNKSLIQYLENRLVDIAKASKRYKVLTKASSSTTFLKEYEVDTMEEFLENIKTLLDALNYRVLEPLPVMPDSVEQPQKIEYLYLTVKVANGKGYITSDKKFVICKGATINNNTAKACPKAAIKKREALKADGLIVDNILQDDIVANSSSMAASIIVGWSISGPEFWKNSDGVALKELQKEE